MLSKVNVDNNVFIKNVDINNVDVNKVDDEVNNHVNDDINQKSI